MTVLEIIGLATVIYVIVGIALMIGVLIVDKKSRQDCRKLPIGALALVMAWPAVAYILWQQLREKDK